MEIVLRQTGALLLRTTDALGAVREEPAATAAQAKAMLHCSLRQLYRYVSQHRLRPAGKFLDQLIFKKEDVEFFHRPRRGRGAGLPKFLRPVFWSYRLARVDPCAHARYVGEQILEHGDARAVGWAIRYYGTDFLVRVAESGRGLSPATRSLWALIGTRRKRKAHAGS